MSTGLVTGASVGIGLAFCRELAHHGYDLVIVARDESRLEAVAQELAAGGIQVEVLAADLSTDAGCDAVMRRLADPARPVDILVNNAGFGINEPFTGGSLAMEERLLAVLCGAVLRLTHAALPGMLRRGRGHIINVSSIAGWAPLSTYSAAKAYTTVFTESLAGELHGSGVTATAVCPGFTRTQFHERAQMHIGLPGAAWVTAETVAREGLRDALSGAVVSVPTLRYKAVALSLRAIPRPLLRRLVSGALRVGRRFPGDDGPHAPVRARGPWDTLSGAGP